VASVVVVGGGVIGCAIAERLSRDGHGVVLLERDRVAAHASGAAAGLLAPLTEEDQAGARSAMALYPDLVERVQRVSGIDVEFREAESLTPALTAAEERVLRRRPGRWLDAAEVLAEEPGLGTRIRGAFLTADAQVSPARLVLALARTAAAQGAEVREGTPASGLALRSGQLQGVHGPEGVVRADVVVVAAGPWSPTLTSPAGIVLNVRPSRGQLVVLSPRGAVLRRIVLWRGAYLVPKPSGSIVAGSTEEEVGFDARPTAEGIRGLLDFAVRAVPALAEATVERTFAALRPATPDGRPVVGRAPELENLILATGHNRTGILEAPLAAERVAEILR
jgi:glycine oxidase